MSVREPSIETYRSTTFQSAAGLIREQIADLLLTRGPMTRRGVAAELHLETGNVSGRVCEMLDADEPVIVELPELQPCPITKRRVHWIAHVNCQSTQRGLPL